MWATLVSLFIARFPPGAHLKLIQNASDGVAGVAVPTPPVLRLLDENGTLVTNHSANLRVLAEWETFTYTTEMTGEVGVAVRRAVGEPNIVTRGASVLLVNGVANFTNALTITYASDKLVLTYTLEPPQADVEPLLADPIRVTAGTPYSLVVLHDPSGYFECSPFALQPKLAIKDFYNNTVKSGLPPALSALAYVSKGGVGLLGSYAAPFYYGIANFASLGTNGSALKIHLRFELTGSPPPAPPPIAPPSPPAESESGSGDSGSGSGDVVDGGSSGSDDSGSGSGEDTGSVSTWTAEEIFAANVIAQRLRPTLSAAVDCHGVPVRIAILPSYRHPTGGVGAPLSLEALDVDGVRTTGINGAELYTFLLFADGSRRATGVAKLATRGVWSFGYDDDPLGIALSQGVESVVLRANLTGWLNLPVGSNRTCCELEIPRVSDEYSGETIYDLYMPPLRVSRLFARNTGQQGGYDTGDSMEITFARRTDRAGFAVGEILRRKTIDELLIFDHQLGTHPDAYAGVWRDDCTLMLVVGNTTEVPTTHGTFGPTTGVFRLRMRDDIHELRDYNRHLHMASVAESPVLEGTFGAATGHQGRTDALRQALPDLAVRRALPSTFITMDDYRIGPMSWHPTVTYDVTRDRTSECDVNYAQPDGHTGPALPNSQPPYALDEPTLLLIREAVTAMARMAPSLLPFTHEPHGMPKDTEHDHDTHAPPPAPWTPQDEKQQHDERAAAAAVGPNGQAQRYYMRLNDIGEEHRKAFGLEEQPHVV